MRRFEIAGLRFQQTIEHFGAFGAARGKLLIGCFVNGFQTIELNLCLNRLVAFCPQKENIKAAFYGKSLTVKDCTERAASASRKFKCWLNYYGV